MQEEHMLNQSTQTADVDDETRRFVRQATTQLVNAAITRRLAGAARLEARRDQIGDRVWRVALTVAALCAVVMALFVVERVLSS